MSNSYIWQIDRTLSDATTPGQSGPESNVNEGVLRISQSSSITGASPSYSLVSYPEHSLDRSYLSAELLYVYSTVPADCATGHSLGGVEGSYSTAEMQWVYSTTPDRCSGNILTVCKWMNRDQLNN